MFTDRFHVVQVGEKVIVGNTRTGVIRFKGTVSFAPG